MIQTANTQALLAFTQSTAFIFQSTIYDRTQWNTTPNFQQLILPDIGCVAGKSLFNQYGYTWWYCNAGLINLNNAFASLQSSEVMTVDGEMARSKYNMSSDLSGICAASMENMLLVSVPSGDVYNAHTWAMDQAPMGQAGGAPGRWSGAWTGFRPVQWDKAYILGLQRMFCLSMDSSVRDGATIHVWEAFSPYREDNYGPIKCQFETSMVMQPNYMKFSYVELDLVEILGEVNLTVYVGGVTGPWKQIFKGAIYADRGSLGSAAQPIITLDSLLQEFKPQSRVIRCESLIPTAGDNSVESNRAGNIDRGFAVLMQWQGRMGVRGVRLVVEEADEFKLGSGQLSELPGVNMINEGGQNVAPAT